MTKSEFKEHVRLFLPNWVLDCYHNTKWSTRRFVRFQWQAFKTPLKEFNLKHSHKVINVAFFLLRDNEWKNDVLYRDMEKDPHFNPFIVIVPDMVMRPEELRYEQINRSVRTFEEKGYKVYKSYDNESGKWLNAHKLNIDIIFMNNQYEHTHRKYSYRLYNSLMCFINYGFTSVPYDWSCASDVHRSAWRYFVDSEMNLKQIAQFMPTKNCVVTGYPQADILSEYQPTGKDWKLKDSKLKRIIWAPHHSINPGFHLSTFLLYSDFMLQLAEKYKDQIQWVFKPHPELLKTLYKHPDWGKEKADAYYEKWQMLENASYINSEYIDLFLTSDALIHDCGSFIIEYLYTKKPVLYLANCDRESQSNEVGKWAYNCHYHAVTEIEIENFVKNVVLEGKDSMKSERAEFYNKVLLPPNGMSVSQNIIYEIKKSLNRL